MYSIEYEFVLVKTSTPLVKINIKKTKKKITKIKTGPRRSAIHVKESTLTEEKTTIFNQIHSRHTETASFQSRMT